MSDKILILNILEDLQNLFENNEKKVNEKSAFTYAAAKASVSGKKEFTFKGKKHPVKMSKEKAKKIVNEAEKNNNIKEFLDIMKEYVDESSSLDEKKKKKKKKSKRAKGLAKAASLYKQGKIKQAAAVRQRMEKGERKKKGFKNVPRSDTRMAENMKINLEVLREYIEEELQLAALNKFIAENNHLLDPEFEKELFETNDLDEKRKRKKRKKKKSGKSPKGLSAAVKKSLDKKADKRGLTRGSVYAEFRKGLAAFLSSGSRKGMTAHQWAHARVNSANPSKSWASVKKKKGGKKKK